MPAQVRRRPLAIKDERPRTALRPPIQHAAMRRFLPSSEPTTASEPYIWAYIGSYIPYIYPTISKTVENITLPRQFARLFEPDPIRFLLPSGHQRATRPAYRTVLGKSYWVGLSSRATTNWRGQFPTLLTT